MTTINKELALTHLPKLDDKDLGWLALETLKEQTRRRVERYMRRLALQSAYRGMANFMAGVTWALACRASLRQSKEHPSIGKGLASGEMWYPWEMVYAVRHEVKQRGWSPIQAKDARDVVRQLRIEHDRKDTSKAPDFVAFRPAYSGQYVALHRPPSQRWADAQEMVDKMVDSTGLK